MSINSQKLKAAIEKNSIVLYENNKYKLIGYVFMFENGKKSKSLVLRDLNGCRCIITADPNKTNLIGGDERFEK